MNPKQYMSALHSAIGAIHALQEQVNQMRGMFPDEDGTIEEAMGNGDETVEEIEAVLKGAEAEPQIIVELDGGLVQAVRGTGNLVGMIYTVVDFDTEDADEEDDKMESVTWPDGTEESALIHSDEIVEIKYTLDQ